MIFLSFLGLLGLLSILGLIFIYILKPKYQERQIGSSFIWQLSLKYKKRKIPYEWFTSSLLIFIQIVILLILTIILMKPNTVQESTPGEKIIILDTSASMMTVQGEQTLLEKAIDEIGEIAVDTINNNDKFTLITTGVTSEFVAYRTDSVEYVKAQLERIESEFSNATLSDALLLAEEVFTLNPNSEIIYYTSISHDESPNITVRNMSNNEWNVAILDFQGAFDTSLNYVFTVELVSYGQSLDNVVLQLDLDGNYETSTSISLNQDEITTHTFSIAGQNENSFDQARVSLVDIEDDFVYDNQLEYASEEDPFYVQIVLPENLEQINTTSEYISRALRSLNRDYSIQTTVDLENATTSEYDLYIYVEDVPSDLPKDGAVWIFDPTSLPTDLEATVGDEITVNNEAFVPTNLATDSYAEITKLVRENQITVSKYTELDSYTSFDVLYTVDTNPVLLTRNIEGVQVTIFPFGLDYSNLPVLFYDFPILTNNLSEYSVKPIFEDNMYYPGMDLTLHQNPITETIEVKTQDGTVSYEEFPVTLSLDTLGSYEVTQYLSDGRRIVDDLYVRVPREESLFDTTGEEIILNIPLEPEVPVLEQSNLYSLIPYFAIGLLVLIVIEWEVQHREQY